MEMDTEASLIFAVAATVKTYLQSPSNTKTRTGLPERSVPNHFAGCPTDRAKRQRQASLSPCGNGTCVNTLATNNGFRLDGTGTHDVLDKWGSQKEQNL